MSSSTAVVVETHEEDDIARKASNDSDKF